jgi:hypothetical protein
MLRIDINKQIMAYLIAIYLLFLIIFGYFSAIGVSYLRAGGRGTLASKRAVAWYLSLSISFIILTFVAIGLEYYFIP